MSLLAFRQVTKRFADGAARTVVVLDRVSFEVEVGETVGLYAARRGGKSTLLSIAAGLIVPDEGQVLWDGVDLSVMGRDGCAEVRRSGGVALARGEWCTSRSESVRRHVVTPLYSDDLSMRAAEQRASWALGLVGAPQLGSRDVSELGLSERPLVELARAIAREPRLLLVDEPAVFRRPDDARAFNELLRSLPKKIGCALLITSEELSALLGCKPMMSLTDGRLISTASLGEVIDFPATGGGLGAA